MGLIGEARLISYDRERFARAAHEARDALQPSPSKVLGDRVAKPAPELAGEVDGVDSSAGRQLFDGRWAHRIVERLFYFGQPARRRAAASLVRLESQRGQRVERRLFELIGAAILVGGCAQHLEHSQKSRHGWTGVMPAPFSKGLVSRLE